MVLKICMEKGWCTKLAWKDKDGFKVSWRRKGVKKMMIIIMIINNNNNSNN